MKNKIEDITYEDVEALKARLSVEDAAIIEFMQKSMAKVVSIFSAVEDLVDSAEQLADDFKSFKREYKRIAKIPVSEFDIGA